MNKALNIYVDSYEDIVKSMSISRHLSYYASPHYVIPRIVRGVAELHDDLNFIAFGDPGRAKLIFPLGSPEPKDFILLLMEAIRKYGGVYDIPKPYADALRKRYKVQPRPWGYHDFLIPTERLCTLSGKSLKTTRRWRNRYLGDYSHRAILPTDMDRLDRLETVWRKSREGRVGNQGYTRMFLETVANVEDVFYARAIAIVDEEGEFISAAIGNVVNCNTWTCGFSYGRPEFPHSGDVACHLLAREYYSDLETELDGPGGAPGSGMYKHKELFSHRISTQYVAGKR